jgi:hypothetical protein
MYTDNLNTLKRKKGRWRYSPVGSYIIVCKEIEEQWVDQADDVSLDIHETNKPGIFVASLDFRILKGAMIISAEKDNVEQY